MLELFALKEPPDPLDPLGGLLGLGADEAIADAEDAGAGAELDADGAGTLGEEYTEDATTFGVEGSGVLECSNSGATTLVADMDGEAITAGEEGATTAGDEEATTGGAEEAKTAAREV